MTFHHAKSGFWLLGRGKIIQEKSLDVFCLLLLSLVISSCTVAIPPDRDKISSKLGNSFATSNQMETTPSIYWEQSFPCPLLAADIMKLIDQNYELAASEARVEQAAAAYGIIQSQQYPVVEAAVDFNRSHMQDDQTKESTSNKRTTVSFNAALRWEPDIWGRLRAREAAAALLFEEKQVLSQQVALNLTTLLVESWISLRATKNLEAVLYKQQKTNQEILELTELRLAQGGGNSLDILQQRGRVIGVERILPGVISERKRVENSYAVLMGRLPGEHTVPQSELPALEPLAAITSPKQLMSDRPDLQAAFLALQVADQQVAAAIKDRLPRLAIELAYTESGSDLTRIGDHSVLQFTTGLLAPVFDAGRLRTKVVQQRAYAAEQLAVLEQALLNAVMEVEDTLIREQTLFEENRLLTKELSVAEETVNKARLQYVNGQNTFLPVLAALAKLQTLQQEQITLTRDILVNRVHLLKALGAKWSHSLEDT